MSLEGLRPKEAETYLKRLKPGCVLLSHKTMADPNFSDTIVLICHYNEEGAYGLVLNRVSHMPLSEVFNSLDFHQKGVKKVFIGGPVQEGELQIIQHSEESVLEATQLASNIHLGGHWTEIDRILNLNPPKIRLFLGYSGWGAQQLELEIQAGGWEVYQPELNHFLGQPEDPWDKLAFEELRHQMMAEAGDL